MMDSVKNTVYESTIKRGFCSGCGVCRYVCPYDAIKMEYTGQKMFIPMINRNKCINCGKCAKFCVNSFLNKNKRIELLRKSRDSISVGIADARGYYRCKTRKYNELMKSASGGFVTAFASKLLELGIVDCVLHAERILAYTGEPHYRACISTSIEELDERRSSIYGPVSFDNVISNFENEKKKVLAIGVPCAISSLKKIFCEEEKFKENVLFTIALVCSHNVTGQFVDFFAKYYEIPENEKYTVNLRGKNHDMENRGSFRLHYINADGKKIVDQDRKMFNPAWRNYYFAMDACSYCTDLWGYDADISTKDCWGAEGEADRYGSSLVIFRNKKLLEIFLRMKELEVQAIPFQSVRVCEYPSAVYKQKDIVERFNATEVKSDFLVNSIRSKEMFERGEFEKIKSQIANVREQKRISVMPKMRENLLWIGRKLHLESLYFTLKPTMNIFRNIFHYKKKKYNKIIMLGGFDGSNAGDEAQIDATVKIMMDRYPGYLVKVLSHVPYHTWSHHYNCVVGPSPRMYIWDLDEEPFLYCSSLRNRFDRFRFLAKGYWTCFNAYFVRCNLPTFFLNAKKATILQEIKTSDLLYISGGGTMTGDTLSRCWDNVFCMKIAKIFKVPFVMSGQNSGNWDSKFTEHFVSKIYKKANAITFRDVFAVENMKKAGVDRDCVFTMFDDALFCDKQSDVSDFLELFDIKGNYIALNIHYWGCENDQEEQITLLNKIAKICDYMYEKTGYEILLVPMSDTDEMPIEDFIGMYSGNYVKVARVSEYDFRIIRGLLAKAKYCVTMKHHPIIFAIGEKVPTISIAYKPYYTYKNVGALEIFYLGKYSIDLEQDNFLELFSSLFDDLCKNHDQIVTEIASCLENLKERREKFLSIIDSLLK